jgi:hypothetical protein
VLLTLLPLLRVVGSCTRLKSLEIPFCDSFQDATLHALAVSSHGLEKLVIAGCSSITDKSVPLVAQRLANSLTHLDMSSLPSVSSASVELLLQGCVHLRVAIFDRLQGVQDRAFAGPLSAGNGDFPYPSAFRAAFCPKLYRRLSPQTWRTSPSPRVAPSRTSASGVSWACAPA